MHAASLAFGAGLILVAILMQIWSGGAWRELQNARAEGEAVGLGGLVGSANQYRRRRWTNMLIGMIGGVMIVSSFLPRGQLWLIAWGLVGMMLIMIVLLAVLDLFSTWHQYRVQLDQLAQRSLATSKDRASVQNESEAQSS